MLDGVKLGDSIAVNGVCLTVTEFDEKTFTVGLSPETLRLSNLGDIKANTPQGRVNLERYYIIHALFPRATVGH